MASMNKVILCGNLTRDPEVKFIGNDNVAVADFGLAMNEKYKTVDGDWKTNVTYVDIKVWKRQAETVGEYLSKGSSVIVEGKITMDTWENKEGERRSKTYVTANRVHFFGGKKDEQPSNSQADDENCPF